MISPAWPDIKVYLQHVTRLKRIDREKAKQAVDNAKLCDPKMMEEALRYGHSIMYAPAREVVKILSSK